MGDRSNHAISSDSFAGDRPWNSAIHTLKPGFHVIAYLVQTLLDFLTIMAPNSTDYKYIQLNEKGVPVIADTTMKVVELITAVKAYGWSPDDLHANYPHLSMSQIHSALAYYWDHKVDIDAEIERIDQWADNMRQQAGESLVARKLREQSLL